MFFDGQMKSSLLSEAKIRSKSLFELRYWKEKKKGSCTLFNDDSRKNRVSVYRESRCLSVPVVLLSEEEMGRKFFNLAAGLQRMKKRKINNINKKKVEHREWVRAREAN